MSTSAKSTKQSPIESHSKADKLKKLMFDFRDSNAWCGDCDFHFETILDYCQHLHKHEHSQNVKKTPTSWRSHKEFIDKRKTYDLLKSICSKVANEINENFSIQDLDKVLTPGIDKEVYRAKFLLREKGKFEKNDSLFEPKGLNYLVPITGFYCNLCSLALCDQVEVNLHMRSHDHNHAYIKSVALNPQYETVLRTKYLKSYKSKYNKIPPGFSSEEMDNNSGDKNNTTKKQNSDNLKSILKGDRSSEKEKSRSERILPPASKVSERASSREMPEIIAISASRTKPSALKRLRSDNVTRRNSDDLKVPDEKRTKTTDQQLDTCLSDIDSESPEEMDVDENNSDRASEKEEEREEVDEIDEIEQTNEMTMPQLEKGDVENPFPELDLFISGNLHVDILKDSKLAKPSKIKLKKLKFDEYKGMLLDTTTLIARISQLITKKEPDMIRKDFGDKVVTKPTFFDQSGKSMPIDLDNDDASTKTKTRADRIKSEEEEEARKKRNKAKNINDGECEAMVINDEGDADKQIISDRGKKSAKKDDENSDRSISPLPTDQIRQSDLDALNSNLSDEKKNSEIDMSFLQDFFCEK